MNRVKRFLLFYEYFVSGSVASALCVGLFTLACWFFLTEYWMARRFSFWGDAWERFFILPAIVFPALLALLGCIVQHCEHTVKCPLELDGEGAPIAGWIAMIYEAARHRRFGLTRRFLHWQARQLAKYGKQEAKLEKAEFPSAWRLAWPHWVSMAWFPLLLLCLLSPLPILMMERIVDIWPSYPEDWEAVVYRSPAQGPLRHESLSQPGDDGDLFRQSPEKFPDGWLVVAAPSFPRTFRRLRAICSGCTISDDPMHPFGLLLMIPLRGGHALIHFKSDPAVLDLDLGLTVMQRDGITVVRKIILH